MKLGKKVLTYAFLRGIFKLSLIPVIRTALYGNYGGRYTEAISRIHRVPAASTGPEEVASGGVDHGKVSGIGTQPACHVIQRGGYRDPSVYIAVVARTLGVLQNEPKPQNARESGWVQRNMVLQSAIGR